MAPKRSSSQQNPDTHSNFALTVSFPDANNSALLLCSVMCILHLSKSRQVVGISFGQWVLSGNDFVNKWHDPHQCRNSCDGAHFPCWIVCWSITPHVERRMCMCCNGLELSDHTTCYGSFALFTFTKRRKTTALNPKAQTTGEQWIDLMFQGVVACTRPSASLLSETPNN